MPTYMQKRTHACMIIHTRLSFSLHNVQAPGKFIVPSLKNYHTAHETTSKDKNHGMNANVMLRKAKDVLSQIALTLSLFNTRISKVSFHDW